MTVNFDSIISTSSSEENFLKIFEGAFSQQDQPLLEAYRAILTACYRNPGLSPNLTASTPEMLAKAWLKKYNDSYENRISRRISKLPGTVADPIVSIIINARLTGLTTEHLEQIKYAHRLSMSAENIQGLLLDFCNVDGSLLQVKNRSNSENSSSSRVRINQPIEKWYRVDARTGSYRWFHFHNKYNTDRFSEENFVAFVQQVLIGNSDALAIEAENPWKNLSNQVKR